MAVGADVTDLIRAQARSMGFLDVGFTSHDMRFVFQDRKEHVKYPNAVCLALEQDFEETQTAPSMAAEHGHYGTYETQAPMGLLALLSGVEPSDTPTINQAKERLTNLPTQIATTPARIEAGTRLQSQ